MNANSFQQNERQNTRERERETKRVAQSKNFNSILFLLLLPLVLFATIAIITFQHRPNLFAVLFQCTAVKTYIYKFPHTYMHMYLYKHLHKLGGAFFISTLSI